MTIDGYLRLPWTIIRSDRDDDGEYIVLEVAELPGFVVACSTKDEVESEFWPALRAFLLSYLDNGDEPPIPAGAGRSGMTTRWTPDLESTNSFPTHVEWEHGQATLTIDGDLMVGGRIRMGKSGKWRLSPSHTIPAEALPRLKQLLDTVLHESP